RGYVASLGRPGGNITGLASSRDDATPKKLELLSTLIPGLTRVGFLFNPKSTQHAAVLTIAHDAAQNAKLALVRVDLGHPQDIDKVFTVAAQERVGALVATGDALFFSLRHQIAEMALKARLPTLFSQREYVEAGALMSYGESLA